MLVIGVTGNFGTGKTTVSQMLAELGAVVINADELGHELHQPNSPTYQQVVAAFGKSILKPNGEIDRHKLGQIVFDNSAALTRLNRIMHPRMYEIAKQRIAEHRQAGARVLVLEAAVLIEAGWTSLVDQLWVITAPEAVIVERLKSSRGLSEEQIVTRLRSQMPLEEKAKRADVVISTDCHMDALRAKVTEIWHNLAAETEA